MKVLAQAVLNEQETHLCEISDYCVEQDMLRLSGKVVLVLVAADSAVGSVVDEFGVGGGEAAGVVGASSDGTDVGGWEREDGRVAGYHRRRRL